MHINVIDPLGYIAKMLHGNSMATHGNNFTFISDITEFCQKKHPCDLIIFDTDNPDMEQDFIQVIKRKEYFDLDWIPILIITSNNNEFILTCIEKGAADYLLKPVSVDELLLKLQAIDKFTIRHRDLHYRLNLSESIANRSLDSINDAVVALDLAGNIKHLNRAFCEMSGLSSIGMGKNIDALAKLSYLEAEFSFAHLMTKVVDLKQPVIIKRGTEFIPKFAKKLLIEGNVSLVMDLNQMPVEIIVSFRDVGNQILLEKSMHKTEKMASINILAAGMAHEMNNPLEGIILGLINIQRYLDPGFVKNHPIARQCDLDLNNLQHYLEQRGIDTIFTMMNDVAVRAACIVKRILEISNNSGSQFNYTSIETLARGAISVLSQEGYANEISNICIQFDIAKDMPLVVCDQSEFGRVMMILFRNAIKALKNVNKKIIKLHLSIDNEDVLMKFYDNGAGIPQDMLNRVFDPFFTTDPACSGLGLFTAYFIITEIHHGSIVVNSKPNVGTTFTIRFPRDISND